MPILSGRTHPYPAHGLSNSQKRESEVIFLNHGTIVESGTLSELYERYDGLGEVSIEKIYMLLCTAVTVFLTSRLKSYLLTAVVALVVLVVPLLLCLTDMKAGGISLNWFFL